MKQMSSLTGLSLAVVSALLLGVNSAVAASGTWNGTSDGFWTNSTNWSSAPYAGAAAGETATFTNATGATTLDLSGLASIRSIVFDEAGVAACTLGSGAANSQTLALEGGGEVHVTDDAGQGPTVNAALRLGPLGTETASFSLRNDSATQTLTLNNAGGTSGTKTLHIDGSGTIAIAGNLSGGTIDLNLNSTGTLELSGINTLRQLQVNGSGSVINLTAGTTTFANSGGSNLKSAEDCTINGPGKIILSMSGTTGVNFGDNAAASGKTMTINAPIGGSIAATGFECSHPSYTDGTIALLGANDYSGITIMNNRGTIMCTNLNNNGTVGNLGKGTAFRLNSTGARLLYTGPGQSTTRTIELYQSGILEQGGSGNLNLTAPIVVTSGSKSLTLQGSTTGTGEYSGLLWNNAGTLSVTKAGSGTWTLSANNTYSGATAVNEGTLEISGLNGAAKSTSGITVAAGATLQLKNSAAGNNGDRLSDSGTITLNSATLSFVNDADASTSYSETIGTVTLVNGTSTINAGQAAAGQTSTITITAFALAGGKVDFTGTGLGDGSGQNKIVITGQPDGMIGTWATVNGTAFAAYSSTRGVYASDGLPTGIAARGPGSVVPDDAGAQVIINDVGTSGPITLAGAFTNTTFLLTQDTNTAAVVQTVNGSTNKTFQISALQINAGRAALTIGENEGDGTVMAQAAGGTMTLQNDSTAELTVNAAVVNNASASSILKLGTGDVRLAGTNTYTGPTTIGQGTLIVDGASVQTLPGIIGGAGALTKAGNGTLTLSGGNTYAGETLISAGTVVAQNSAALGSAAAGTTVASGATLDLGGTLAAQVLNMSGELITVSGTGVANQGALINSSNTSQYNALRRVELTGDTTFGGEQAGGRWDIRNTAGNGSLNMNGYTITKVGANLVGLTSVDVSNPGNIDIQQGSFRAEVITDFNGDSNNVMTVRNGAIFEWYQTRTAIEWTLILQNGAILSSISGNDPDWSIWAGPVTLNGTATLQGAASTSHAIRGPVSGSGSIIKTGDATVYLRSTNSTYTGTTTVSQGTLYAEHAGSLPGYNTGKVTVNDGVRFLTVKVGDGTNGWSNAQIKDLHDTATFKGYEAFLGIDTAGIDRNYENDFPVPMGIAKLGNGVFTVDGVPPMESVIRVYSGELVLHDLNNYVTNKNCFIGVDNGNFGILTLSGSSTLTSFVYPYNTGGHQQIFVGNNGKGVLNIKDNAAITNKLIVGNGTTGAGAVYQNGGFFDNLGGAGNDGRIGVSGYGYYELNDGYYKQRGFSQLGYNGSGIGILRLQGGTFEQSNVYGGNLGISRGGTGLLHQRGGLFTTPVILEIGDDSNGTAPYVNYADYTIEGGAATITSDILLANRNDVFATLNLNGGLVSANRIYRSGTRTGSKAYVNFDGGTFQDRNGGNVIDSGTTAPDAVNIFAGGAVIDSQANACTMPVPLLAPTSNGVASVSVLTQGAGYIGPPMVRITGGDGFGATAVADIDYASGKVTGITVTSPGFGYTTAPTVALSGGGFSTAATVSLTMGANVSGGLTKIGTGSLTLDAVNTYSGTTVISNGVLKLGRSDAILPGNDIRVDGGTYDLNRFVITNGTVTATSGRIINGVLVSDSFTKSEPGDLILDVPIHVTAPLVINGGYLRLGRSMPGLYEGSAAGNVATVPNPATDVTLGMDMADSTTGWPTNTTYIYTGYLWNRASTNVTWTFLENFDDKVRLSIDGITVLSNDASATPTTNNYTLVPGPHFIEARFGQGTGGAGPSGGGWFADGKNLGIAYDPFGRGAPVIANYLKLIDPGDGSFFTTELTPNNVSDVEISGDSTLDLGGTELVLVTLSGAGTVSNGTLAVTTTLAPGGVNVIGTLSIGAALTLNGELLIDVAADGSSDLLAVTGDLDLSAGTLTIANPAQLNSSKQYTIATCSGTLTQPFAAVTIDSNDSHWKVKYMPDGTVKLIYQGGTMIILR